ncbi:MAG: hypothetical protein AABO41_04780 [Acidobacteriota bacterium]
MRNVLLILLLSLTACVPNRSFRQSVSVYPPIPGESPYTLAFIEFDDMGEFWDRTQLNRALQSINDAKARGNGQVIVVTFVHGWKNNASDDSGNVWGFRDELKDIAGRSGNIPVVGVYIGWRGAATNVPFLKELSFGNRRNAAIRIPGANITEALHKIMRTTKQGENDRSKCVLIGHSFGGMVLERALTQSMVSLINDEEEKNGKTGASRISIPSPADLIVFVNSAAPATEGKQFLGMLKAGHYYYRSGTRDVPFFLAITSKGDTATEFLMPIGHFPSKITKAMRQYDLCDPDAHPEFPPGIPNQSTYYLHSTANSPVLQSHEIFVSDRPDDDPANCAEVHQKWYCVRPKANRWNDTPYWAMRMQAEIVPDHGTIFRPEFRRLLEVFLPTRDETPRTLERVAIPNITSSQLDLSSKIQKKRSELEASWVRHKNEKEGQDALKEARDILGKLNVSGTCLANPDNVFQLLRNKIKDIVSDPSKVVQIAEAMGIKSDQ